jgi:hypothetical protein
MYIIKELSTKWFSIFFAEKNVLSLSQVSFIENKTKAFGAIFS